jgi:integrase
MSYSIIPVPKWDKFSTVHKAYPIWFRIKVGSAPHFFEKTDLYIDRKDEWHKKKKRVQLRPDANRINDALDLKRIALRDRVIKEQSEDKEITRETVKGKKARSLFEYAREIRGDNNTTNVILNRIKKVNGREPRISEITAEWCRKLEHKMRTQAIPEGDKRKGRLKEIDKDKKGYSETTINMTLRLIRKVQNVAIIEGNWGKKVLGKGLYEVPPESKHLATWLVRDQRERWLQGMVDHVLEDPEMHMVLVYFMLGCYAALRISDWHSFDPKTKIKGGTIHLLTHKTEGEVVYDINRSLRLVLNEIKAIGPLTINGNRLRKILKKICKHEYFNVGLELNPHDARHTFGKYMVEEGVLETDCAIFMGINAATVRKYYYHVDNKDRRQRNKHLLER